MGRKPTNPVGKLFFTYNIEKDESTCNVKGCCRPIMKGQHSHNLETHIKTSHIQEWNILVKAKEDIENEKIASKKEKRRLDDTVTFPSKVKPTQFSICLFLFSYFVIVSNTH